MSVDVGDLVEINGYYYTIQDITPQGIYIYHESAPENISLLEFKPAMQQWQVTNYTVPHKVNFMKRVSEISRPEERFGIKFTGDRNKDMNILLSVDYDKLYQICYENLSPLCSDEYFWGKKVEQDFSSLVKRLKSGVKKSQTQYADIIRNLYGHPDALDALENDVLLVLQQHKRLPLPYQERLADKAALEGDIELLRALAETGLYPTRQGIIEAARKERLNVLDWLKSQGIDVQAEALVAYTRGHKNKRYSLLNWLLDREGLDMDEINTVRKIVKGKLSLVDEHGNRIF